MSGVPLELVVLVLAPFVGSFLGVLALRLPAGEGIVAGRSSCPSCKTKLGPVELVPVLSWIWLKGKCRHCGTAISPFYPGIELAAFAVALWAVLATDGSVMGVSALLAWWLLALAVIDFRTFSLPDVLTLSLIPIGLAAVYVLNPDGPQGALIGTLAGFLLMLGIHLLYRALRDREGLGFGDVKLYAAAGAWVGWMGLASVLLWAVVSAVIYVLLRYLSGHKMGPKTKLPFGTFLCLGLWLVWLYGPLIPL